MSFIKKIFSKNSRPQEGGIFFESISKIIGFKPTNIENYQNAFTHRSNNKLDKQGNVFYGNS
jgi:ribonuclease-3